MSTLYTCVSEKGKKDIIILNPNYSRCELAEKLGTTESSDWLGKVLNEGINLQKDMKIKCRKDGCITTQQKGSVYYFYKGDTLTLYPDGVFSIKPGLLRRILIWCTK